MVWISVTRSKDGSAGAKALFILGTLSARLKPCPDTRHLRISIGGFSGAREDPRYCDGCDLFRVQLLEPVVHVAEGAKELEAGFGEVEGGIEGVLILLALVDAG